MGKTKGKFLSISILVAALLVSGSLVFLGVNLSNEISDEELNKKVAAGIEAYVKDQKQKEDDARQTVKVSKVFSKDLAGDSPVLGQKDAPLTMVEFSDYECPFCKRYFVDTYPTLEEKYIKTGKINLVFRNYPLPFHQPLAGKEANAALCVRDQKGDAAYFQYHDLIFINTTSNGKGLDEAKLPEFAVQVGADKAQFTACMTADKFAKTIEKDAKDGGNAGVTGTPTFFIGDSIISGAEDASVFERVIDAELKKLEK